MGYTKEAVKGVSWTGGFRVVTRLISFAKTAIVARILSPSQFGVFGIALLVLAFVEILTETGINVFLIQQQEDVDKYINTAWIISILRGILIAICILTTAPLIASFFSAPDALFLLQLISIVPILRGFINPSVVKFQKDLQFNKEFYFRLIIFSIDTSLSILFTFLLESPVGIILGLIGGVVLEVTLSYIIVQPIPRFVFQENYFKQILNKGKWITTGGIFNYLFENTDNIVVGKLLGTASLGLYDAAYSIALLPLTEIGDVLAKVLFPVYVKFVDEKERLQRAFIKTMSSVLVVAPIVGMIFFIFPREVIQIVLGSKWLEAAPLLRVLAIFGIIRAMVGVCNTLFFATKRQDIVTAINLFSFLFLSTTIIFSIRRFGLVGASYSVLAAMLLVVPFIVYQVVRILSGSTKKT